jgi:hypothetical protein
LAISEPYFSSNVAQSPLLFAQKNVLSKATT